MSTTFERPSLAERLNDPQTSEVLHRLLDHAETLDQALTAAGELPNLIAIAVDFFDAVNPKADSWIIIKLSSSAAERRASPSRRVCGTPTRRWML